PGVPDIYQGNEIWDFSLVDPDNRRPVDYGMRKHMLGGLAGATREDLLGNWRDGRIKLFLTQRLLTFRRENAELFAAGSYVPLQVTGELAACCIAFAREWNNQAIVVLAPRLSSKVGFPPIGEKWRDTAVQLPDSFTGGSDLFTGAAIKATAGAVALAQAFARLPFAVWEVRQDD
ncbi:MAG: malto-oligosyltrehalose synthase, partial [Chthoniobacterales bacterium]